MLLEHIAFQVSDPAAAADWYVAHLGFTIRKSVDSPVCARFIGDGRNMMLEIYHNPEVPVPDYPSLDPRVLHVALACGDIPATTARLVAAGAKLLSGPEVAGGDHFAMLRDPWGLPIQLVCRGKPMGQVGAAS